MLVACRRDELRPRATSMHARQLQLNVWKSWKSCTKIVEFALVLAFLQTASKNMLESQSSLKIRYLTLFFKQAYQYHVICVFWIVFAFVLVFVDAKLLFLGRKFHLLCFESWISSNAPIGIREGCQLELSSQFSSFEKENPVRPMRTRHSE